MVIWPPGPLVEKDARTGTWQMLAPSRFWIVSIWRYFLAGGDFIPPDCAAGRVAKAGHNVMGRWESNPR